MPTPQEVDEVIGDIERMESDYHALGLHNNRKVARERIRDYRRRKSDVREPLTQFGIDGRGEHRRSFWATLSQIRNAVLPSTQAEVK